MSDRIAELEASLAAALERIEALELGTAPAAVSAPATEGSTDDSPASSAEPTDPRIDRRRLLTRGGTAAAGAVLGGVAATIATAAPAAAVDGTFTSLEVDGPSALNGVVTVLADNNLDYGLVVGTAQNHTRGGILGVGLAAGVVGNGIAGVDGEGTGVGVVANGGLYGVMADGARASIILRDPNLPSTSHPDPTTVAVPHATGELYLAGSSELWLCVVAGTPGTWRRIAGVATAGAFSVLNTPTRVYDTRTNSGLPGAGTGPVTGVRHDIDLSGGVPVDATAALVTLTVTNTVANPNAYGQIYANGLVTPPTTSAVNWTQSNDVVATTTTTALTAGKVAISMNPGANVLIDVLGYYR